MAEERLALRTAALSVGQFGIVVAFQAVAIVLPAVGAGLGLAPAALQWLVGATALTYAGGLLVAGRLADRFGARRMLIIGSLVLVVFSGSAAAAPSEAVLIAARAGQGAGMALYTPAMIALLSTGFADEDRRHRALTWWNAAGGAGGFFAVVAGGWVAQYSWRAAFVLLALPPLLTAILTVLAFPAEQDGGAEPPRRVSLINAGLPPLAATLIIFGVTGPNETMSTRTPFLAGAAVLITVWLIRERRARHPLVTTELRNWPALQPILLAVLHAAAINTPIFFYGLFLQAYRGATTFEVGLGYVPANVGLVLGSVLGAAAVRRRGRRFTIAAGMGLVGLSVLLLATVDAASTVWHPFLLGWLLFGIGASAAQLGFIGLAGRLPAAAAGTVAGLLTAGGQLGTAIGLALLVGLAATAEDPIAGYRLGFLGAGVAAALGVIAGVAALGRVRSRTACRGPDRTAVREH